MSALKQAKMTFSSVRSVASTSATVSMAMRAASGDRVAVNAATDRRECDGLQVVGDGEAEAVAIAAGQSLRLAVVAVAVTWADGVNDVAGFQAVAVGEAGLAGGAAADCAALAQQVRAGGAVDGAVDASSAEQGLVGGVDDGVDREGGDVGLLDVDTVHGGIPV